MYNEIFRELNAKKYEILGELERAKHGMIQEMSGIDKCTLSRIREIVAQYDKVDALVTQKINSFQIDNMSFLNYVEGKTLELETGLQQLQSLSEGLQQIQTEVESAGLKTIASGVANAVKQTEELAADYRMLLAKFNGFETGTANAVAENSRDIAELNQGMTNAVNRKILDATRYYVDCVTGSDNNDGSQGHPFRTLDHFFSIVNNSHNGRSDVRCWITSPGVYKIGENEVFHVFSHCTIHICGGSSDENLIDGVVLEFQTTERIKFYEAHTNLRNVTVRMPNTDLLDIDGGVFYFTKCQFECPLKFEYAKGAVTECSFPYLISESCDMTLTGVTVTNADPTRDAFELVNSTVRFVGPFDYSGFTSGQSSDSALFKGILSTIMIQFGVGKRDYSYQYGFEGYGCTIFATQARFDALKNNFSGGVSTSAPCLFVTETTELKA